MIATIGRDVWRTGNASRSSELIPIIGTRRAWAMTLAAARPTRIPVNRPGPMSTATAPISSRLDLSAWRQTNSIAGVSASRRGAGRGTPRTSR